MTYGNSKNSGNSKKQEQQQQQEQRQQQEQQQQPPTLYEMEKPKIGSTGYIYLDTDTQKQRPLEGYVSKIKSSWLGFNKSYIFKLFDKNGTIVKVKTVYTIHKNLAKGGGRRRKSKKLCKKRNSRRFSRCKTKCRRSRTRSNAK